MQRSSRLGAYELKAKLAVGGFCEIWLAHQHGPMGFKRWCALKLLKDDQRREESSRRSLMAEARLVSRLDHPNLIYLLEFGHDAPSGQLYYSMPYVSGRSLTTLVQRGANTPYFGPAEALWIGARVLSGVHHVHALRDEDGKPLSVVHRDVSPENILISFDGALRLIDFGIALSHLVSRQTHFRKVKGKAQYLSPEQARGEHELDARTDIYAIGLVMFYLLSGQEAYSSDFMTALHQARNPQLPSLDQVADIPREIASAVTSMLRVDRRHRAADARELSRRFDSLLGKFYPGYDEWSFRKNVQAILAREKQEELDFLSSLSSGTQVISGGGGAKKREGTQVIADRKREGTQVMNEGDVERPRPAEYYEQPETTELAPLELPLHESTEPVLGRDTATVPDMPALDRRAPQKGSDRSMEDIFEELESLYQDDDKK